MALDKILSKVQSELVRNFGDNLESLVLYGSAATADFHPQLSDINLALVLKRIDLYTLDIVKQFLRKTGGRQIKTPLLLTREYIRTSVDVFPIEFLEIKEKHRLLWGEDVFGSLEIDLKNLRHECEHELKGRLMRLRQSFIEVRESSKAIRQLLLAAHQANYPAFRTALRLRKITPPVIKEEVTAALAVNFSLDAELFHALQRLRTHEIKLGVAGLRALVEKYLIEVEKLAAFIDRI
jgi:predicted nucleotidyltransferase